MGKETHEMEVQQRATKTVYLVAACGKQSQGLTLVRGEY
jgi:hypothetical protein